MPQHLAISLIESGHRVLFVENTGVRSPRLTDASRIVARIKNWMKGTRGFFDIRDGLTVFSPLFIPLPYSRFALTINRFLLSNAINKWMRSSRFYNPILITFLPTPLVNALINDIDPILNIYYCANDMAGGSVGSAPLRPYEDNFFSKADAVFCNSNALMDKAGTYAKRTFLFPAGVDFKKFENARIYADVPFDLKAISGPIVGYVGAISDVFDQKLLFNAAKALPEVSFILIGPVYTDVSLLRLCTNIVFLGMRPHDDVPGYIKGFDVAVIPYIKNSFTDAVYSCKLNEYLAMGASVVTTNLRELQFYVKEHGNVLKIAKNQAEFVEKIRQALAEKDTVAQLKRIKAARKNSWDKRFDGICNVIEELLISKEAIKKNWRDDFVSSLRRNRIRLIKFTSFAITFYMLLLYTPLVWFAGSKLAVRHEPLIADAIIVFSGDGESSYINQSYQRRALDAIKYYKSGYAPLIILSSGREQTFSEAEMIKSLMVSKDVPESAIQVIEKYPHSTFENVLLVKSIIRDMEIKSVLLITSPYHSRRALWVWRKAMPDLLVLAPEVIDTPKASPQWRADLGQIRVIFYEYVAIGYYWFKGWL